MGVWCTLVCGFYLRMSLWLAQSLLALSQQAGGVQALVGGSGGAVL